MKKISFFNLFFILLIITLSTSTNRTIEIKDKTIKKLKTMGNFSLKNVYIKEESKLDGNLYSENSEFNSFLNITGNADFVASAVNENANIKGSFKSENSKFLKNLSVQGPSDLYKTSVEKDSSFHGDAKIIDSNFSGTIYINNTFAPIVIKNSQLKKDLILDYKTKRPKLNLINTKVFGKIIFKGNGVVVSSEDNNKSVIENSYIEENFNINGNLRSENNEFSGILDVNGDAEFVESKINEKANIKGLLKSKKSSFFKNLLVHGKSDLNQTLIKKDSHFYGNTKILDSEFLDTIYIADTDQITINNSKFEKDLIFDSNAREPKINLINSVILGRIIFKNKPGTVLSTKSNITKVDNGRIIRNQKQL